MSTGASLIQTERIRQQIHEGYTAEHDRGHSMDLIRAAEAYLFENDGMARSNPHNPPGSWPWAHEFWKPTGDPVRDLVKAGALIAAAIDSLRGSEEDR